MVCDFFLLLSLYCRCKENKSFLTPDLHQSHLCSLSGAFENDGSAQRRGQTETQFSCQSSSTCNHRYIIISAHSSSRHCMCLTYHFVLDFSPAFTSTHVTTAAAVSPVPAELHAKLALIKHTAEKVQHPIIRVRNDLRNITLMAVV